VEDTGPLVRVVLCPSDERFDFRAHSDDEAHGAAVHYLTETCKLLAWGSPMTISSSLESLQCQSFA
jgi:hypothetical protein